MADFGISEGIALAGMAASAAGAAANMAAQQKRMQAVDQLRKQTQQKIALNQQQAEALWKDTLAKATPEEQTKLTEMNTDQRMAYLQSVAESTPQATNIIKMTGNT